MTAVMTFAIRALIRLLKMVTEYMRDPDLRTFARTLALLAPTRAVALPPDLTIPLPMLLFKTCLPAVLV
jgi:hypothetical protein